MTSPDTLDREENISTTKSKKGNHLEDFLAVQERQKSKINDLKRKEALEREEEMALFKSIEDLFEKSGLNESLLKVKTKDTTNIEELSPSEAISQREKLVRFGMLSNLAYSEFSMVREKELFIHNVILDPLSFNNLNSIFEDRNYFFSEDEKFLWKFIQENKDEPIKNISFKGIPRDIQQIITQSGLPLEKGWREDDEYRNILYASIDTNFHYQASNNRHKNYNLSTKYLTVNLPIQDRTNLLVMGLQALKEKKIKENGNILEQIEGDFQVIDYFPKETDKKNSGFGAIYLEDKNGEKYFAMRGTEIRDWGDIKTDFNLAISRLPEGQSADMVKFIEKNIKPGDKFTIVGHSLGGALTQIATAMYSESINESYTFNSPGAKDLKVPSEGKGLFFDKIKDYKYYRDKEKTGDLITNVRGMSGLSLITGLGEDIGNYEIRLENLSSHSIVKLIEYVAVAESKELRRIYIDRKENKNTDPQK